MKPTDGIALTALLSRIEHPGSLMKMGPRSGTRMGIVVVLTILSFVSGAPLAAAAERVIPIQVRQFQYSQPEITLAKGVPVTLELTSLDVVHGFNSPDLGIRADVIPGKVTRVRIVPQNAGSFVFRCDHFCGGGHEEMSGTIVVKD